VELKNEDFGGTTPNITYQITANGGSGDPYAPTYNTTLLTFTFSSAPPAGITMQKVSGAVSLTSGLIGTGDPRVFTMSVDATPLTGSQETAVFKTTTAGVDPSDHQVFVYKQQTPAGFTGSKFLFKRFWITYTTTQPFTQTYENGQWTYSSATGPINDLATFKAQAALPRNQEHTIYYTWILRYENYSNGAIIDEDLIELGQYGYFLVDEYSGANYVDLTLNPGVGAGYKFKVGARTSPYYAYDDGSSIWPFKTGIAFSATDTKSPVTVATGLPWPLPSTVTKQMNTGSPVLGESPLNGWGTLNPAMDKNVVGLPQHYIPVYGVGVTTDVPVYGLQFDLWVKN
jgi:hypothetical protein